MKITWIQFNYNRHELPTWKQRNVRWFLFLSEHSTPCFEILSEVKKQQPAIEALKEKIVAMETLKEEIYPLKQMPLAKPESTNSDD